MTDDELLDAVNVAMTKLCGVMNELESRMDAADRIEEGLREIHAAWYGEPAPEGHTVNPYVLAGVIQRGRV